MCGPHRRFAPLLSHTLRRIPQEVGIVATQDKTTIFLWGWFWVSIPQAVGAISSSPSFYLLFVQVRDVRTSSSLCSSTVSHPSAHTASGKCCCNRIMIDNLHTLSSFNTASGRCCCLSPLFYLLFVQVSNVWDSSSFCSSAVSYSAAHTVNGRYYYNCIDPSDNNMLDGFQYRKR